MKLLVKKALVVVLCVPFYPLSMFGEWYMKHTSFSSKFNLRAASSEYWKEVWEALTYRKEGR